MDLILYHGQCMDGFCAAYIASKRYPEAQLMPCDHGTEPPYEAVTGKDVLVVDFSWKTREQNDKLASLAKSFQIYDHHKTAQVILGDMPYAVFDMQRSGAGLTWDYLFGKDSDKAFVACTTIDYKVGKLYTPRPWFVNYVEDRDLWNWKLPNSKEICAYLGTLPFTKEAWDKLDITTVESTKIKGIGALAHIEHYVREAVKQAQHGVLHYSPHFAVNVRYSVAAVNALYLNCSEIGNELAEKADIGMTYFERPDGQIQFSLRSIGNIDVSEIAKEYGGGGHRNAAGFQLPISEGRELIDGILGRYAQWLNIL